LVYNTFFSKQINYEIDLSHKLKKHLYKRRVLRRQYLQSWQVVLVSEGQEIGRVVARLGALRLVGVDETKKLKARLENFAQSFVNLREQ
jgi:hypothetical protein